MRVFDPAQKSFEDVADLGVVLRTVGGGPQLHIGFLAKSDDSPAVAIHLKTHFDLASEVPGPQYRWLQVDLDPINRRNVVELAKLIAAKNPKSIPYGFRYNGSCFTVDGDIVGLVPGEGLTCSTFIMAVFETLSITILAADTWSTREDDWGFYAEQLNYLTRTFGDLVGSMAAKHVGDPRFRPDEVAAGAATAKGRPIGFTDAVKLGARIQDQLKRSYKGNPS